MPEFMSLEEAARLLGMSPEELKAKAQHREIRAFQDGGSWQFRKYDIEEEARRRGMGSDPELPLSDLDLDIAKGSPSEAELLSEFQIGAVGPDVAPRSGELEAPSGEEDILLDDRSVPMGGSASSSTVLGLQQPPGKQPSDSDIKIFPEGAKGASDSDVRLGGAPLLSDSDVSLVQDDHLSGSAEVSSIETDPHATLYQDSSEGPVIGSGEYSSSGDHSESDFALTPSSVIDALEPESGSDFELTSLDVSSDEVEAAPKPKLKGPSDSDVTGVEPSSSGINLGRPSDSGINLQSVGGFDFGSADSIELAPLDDDDDAPAAKPSPAKTSPPGQAKVDLSSTAVPMKAAEKDIFEDTDFEVDALDSEGSSDDQTVQLEVASDFDVEDSSESASEVFALDEDEVDQNAATSMAPAPVDEADEFEDSSSEVDSVWDADEPTPSQAARVAQPMITRGDVQPEWGGLWVGMLGVASVLTLLLAFVGMDVVRNLYSFQSDGPISGLVSKLMGG